MEVVVKDEQGLGALLLEQGYSQVQIERAKQTVQRLYEDAAQRVFSEALGWPLPKHVVVEIAPNGTNRFGEESRELACFVASQGSTDCICFTVYDKLVQYILRMDEIVDTAFHEMMHAADCGLIMQNQKLIATIDDDDLKALSDTLRVFDHIRAEGVAILGSHLLMGTPFGKVVNSVKRFSDYYELVMVKSIKWVCNEKAMGSAYAPDVFHATYGFAPSVLVLVLERRGILDKDLAKRILQGLETGTYELSDEEIKSTLLSAMSLNLSEYIQGVVSLGDSIAPMQSFLEFCGLVQKEYEKGDIDTFTKLVRQPKSAQLFNEMVEKILERITPIEVLDERYIDLFEDRDFVAALPDLRDKLDALYFAMKCNEDPEKRQIAQWALSYFFDEKDLIHDDLEGVGWVDDETVIGYALKLLDNA